MSMKIGINVDVFKSNVNSLKASSSSIDFSVSNSLEKTDVNPFKEYENSIQDLAALLAKYKSIVTSDAQQISNIGKAIEDADKRSVGK